MKRRNLLRIGHANCSCKVFKAIGHTLSDTILDFWLGVRHAVFGWLSNGRVPCHLCFSIHFHGYVSEDNHFIEKRDL